MMLLTFVDVVLRYFFNSPIKGGFEVTEMMMAVLIFAGLPLVSRSNEHVTIDAFDRFFPDAFRRAMHVVIHLVCAAALAGMAWLLYRKAGSFAEIGDVTRFPTARHLCSWAGLAPTVRSSDGKARLGHISRQGSPALRWALVEAAQKITTGSGPLREKFERIAKRRGRKIAKVAIAREILTLSYYGLRDGEIRCLARRSRASAKEKLAA